MKTVVQIPATFSSRFVSKTLAAPSISASAPKIYNTCFRLPAGTLRFRNIFIMVRTPVTPISEVPPIAG